MRFTVKGQKETFGDDRNILYLDCSNENMLLLIVMVMTWGLTFVKTH